MLTKDGYHFWPYDGPAPPETHAIEREGHCVLRGAFSSQEVAALRAEILKVYATYPGDHRSDPPNLRIAEAFRYQMFNRSAACQQAIANPRILEIIEPLVGGDCHLVNCTAWRNAPGAVDDPENYHWHIDGGPHVPRPFDADWPDSIPYPIFVIATHIYLDDCELDEGPTTVVPTSHRSGQPPPPDRRHDEVLVYRDRESVSHIVKAGDVGFFVSDVWHRRALPTERSRGRFFLQSNYGRRDIAQRILTTADVNSVAGDARARALTDRERRLLGLHPPSFYDG